MSAAAPPASARSLPRQAVLYAAGEASFRAAEFLLIPLCTRFLDPGEFGRLDAARALGALWMVLLAHGTHEAYLRFHFQIPEQDRRAYFGRMTTYNLVVAAVGTAAGLLALELGRRAGVELAASPLVGLALLVGAAQLLPTLLLSRLQADGRPLAYALVQFGQGAALLLLGGAAVALLALGAPGVLESRLAVYGLATVAVLTYGARQSPLAMPTADERRSAVLYGLPLAGHAVAWQVLNSANRPMLLRFADADAAGIFGVAYSLAVGLTVVITVYNRAWLPRLYALGEAAAARDPRVRLVTLHLFAVCCALAMGLSIFAPELCALLAPPAYAGAAALVPYTAFAFCFLALYQMFANLVWLSRRTTLSFGVGIVAAVANLGLNALLIPAMGVVGAALASLLAFVLFAAMTGRAAARVSGVEPPWVAIGVLTAASVALTALGMRQGTDAAGTAIRATLVLVGAAPVVLYTKRLRARG